MRTFGIVLILLLSAFVLICGCTGNTGTPPSGNSESGVTATPTGTVEVPTATVAPQVTPAVTAELTASEIADRIKAVMLSIESSAKRCADVVAKDGIAGEESLRAIKNCLNDNPGITTITIDDPNLVVVSAEPTEYSYLIGSGAGRQAIDKPTLTKSYVFVEGYRGVSQICPIFADDGKKIGYLEMSYQPRSMIANIVHQLIESTPYNVWVIETDGTSLFDTSSSEIGNNLLTDDLYQDTKLHKFIQTVVKNKEGVGQYTFRDHMTDKVIDKDARWATVDYGGREWRVVLTSPAE